MSGTQKSIILNHMSKAGHITVKQAMVEYSISSLTRRIADLRAEGFDIVSSTVYHPTRPHKRYTRYSIAKGTPKTYEALRRAKRAV